MSDAGKRTEASEAASARLDVTACPASPDVHTETLRRIAEDLVADILRQIEERK